MGEDRFQDPGHRGKCQTAGDRAWRSCSCSGQKGVSSQWKRVRGGDGGGGDGEEGLVEKEMLEVTEKR